MSRCERCGGKDHSTGGHDAAVAADLVFWFEREPAKPGDARAYVDVHAEGLLLRVDDDHFDGELTKPEALALANAIIARYRQ